MKLQKLISCDIYRDGGSFEGIWLTDENAEWAITLLINSWDHPAEIKTYQLFNLKRYSIVDDQRIFKDSPEHHYILEAINEWVSTNNIVLAEIEKETDEYGRLYDLLVRLEKGNY